MRQHSAYEYSKPIDQCQELIETGEETEENIARLKVLLSPWSNEKLPLTEIPEKDGTVYLTLPTLAIVYRKVEFFNALVEKHPENICLNTLEGHKIVSLFQAAIGTRSPVMVKAVLTNPSFLADPDHKAEKHRWLTWAAENDLNYELQEGLPR